MKQSIPRIFPHHEAEIAQMEVISGQAPMVGYWLHAGFLNIDARKMSKSNGALKTIRDTVQVYGGRVLRLFFLSSHYRSSIDFSDASLDQAKNALHRIDEFLFRVDPHLDDLETKPAIDQLTKTVFEALSDDFNAPRALAAVFEFIRTENVRGKSGKSARKLPGKVSETTVSRLAVMPIAKRMISKVTTNGRVSRI